MLIEQYLPMVVAESADRQLQNTMEIRVIWSRTCDVCASAFSLNSRLWEFDRCIASTVEEESEPDMLTFKR